MCHEFDDFNVKLFFKQYFVGIHANQPHEAISQLQRRVLLLLQFYLMKDKECLALDHIEYMITMITELLDSRPSYPVFPFVFIFLKLFFFEKRGVNLIKHF